MPKSSKPKPGPSPGAPERRKAFRLPLTDEQFRRLRVIRAYSPVPFRDLFLADLDRHYEELVIPNLDGNGHGNGHLKGKGRPKAGA